jgi:hypothetical protein
MSEKCTGAISASKNLDTVLKQWVRDALYSLRTETEVDIAEMSPVEIGVLLLDQATPEEIFPVGVMRSWLSCYAQHFGYYLEEGGDE